MAWCWSGTAINSLTPGKYGSNFKSVISTSCGIALKWMHTTILMINQHWFRKWLGVIRQQAIAWGNPDPDLSCHMASQGHNASQYYKTPITLSGFTPYNDPHTWFRHLGIFGYFLLKLLLHRIYPESQVLVLHGQLENTKTNTDKLIVAQWCHMAK